MSFKTGYLLMYILILKGFLVYLADLWTAVSLLVIGNSSINADASIPPEVAKWIFLGAIMISFIILFWEIRKARINVESRDISYSFFSTISSRWYSVKNYKYYCLFQKINSSRKPIDSVAFFVFFTLKGWKKILLAEAPRQVINVVTLVTILPKWIQINDGIVIQNDGLGNTNIQRLMTGTMIFSTLIFAISFILLYCAALIYLPVLCHIQGNLKEYCCHKVDKRIEELLKKQARRRIEQNKIQPDQTSKRSLKKKDIEMQALPEPTLPQINYDTADYLRPVVYQPSLRPQYYHHPSSSNASVILTPHIDRQDSVSSTNSDQQGLISHAQGPSWSLPYTSPSVNESSSSHVQQPYPSYSSHHVYYPYQQQTYF